MTPYNYYGVIDLGHLDTTPGAEGPLAPPSGFAGDAEAYTALLRRRYTDMGAHQHIVLAARRLGRPDRYSSPLELTGPYKETALGVLSKLWMSRC